MSEQQQVHSDINELWQRYRELDKQVYALDASIKELLAEAGDVGQRLIELYHQSDNGLNGAAGHGHNSPSGGA